MTECNHILGYDDSWYEAGLVYSNTKRSDIWREHGTVFNLCPMCGEKLRDKAE